MKVKMQGTHPKNRLRPASISVTINLPNNVDEGLVNRLYVEGISVVDAKRAQSIVMAHAPEEF